MIYPRNEDKRPYSIAAFFTEMSGNTAAKTENQNLDSFKSLTLSESPLKKSERIRENFIRRFVRSFFHRSYMSTYVHDSYSFNFRCIYSYDYVCCSIDSCERRVSSSLVRKTRGRCLTDNAGYCKDGPFCVEHTPSCFYKLDCEYTELCKSCWNMCCKSCCKGCNCTDD